MTADYAWGAVRRTDDGGLELSYAQPSPPLSTNEANRAHWARRRAATVTWRDAAIVMTRWALARLARGPEPWKPQPVTITLDLAFRTRRTRDPHNYVGTVVKATVDGLVRGGLIPDDSPEWATIVEPTLTIQPDKAKPLLATVTITPRS